MSIDIFLFDRLPSLEFKFRSKIATDMDNVTALCNYEVKSKNFGIHVINLGNIFVFLKGSKI